MLDPQNNASRKQIILREAARLFREKGYQASNLRELAKRSGIQGGSIYHHFSSKQEILFQLMDNTMSELLNNLNRNIEDESCPVEMLRKAVHFHIGYHVGDSDATYVTDEELRNLDLENHGVIIQKRDRYQGIFEDILKEGIQRGIIRETDVKLTTMAIIQMCTGVSFWFNPEGPMTIVEIAETYIELICSGVMAKKIPGESNEPSAHSSFRPTNETGAIYG